MKQRPDIESLLAKAQNAWEAMTHEMKQEMRDAQRKSWVIGEFMIQHPSATRQHAEEIYEKVVIGRRPLVQGPDRRRGLDV